MNVMIEHHADTSMAKSKPLNLGQSILLSLGIICLSGCQENNSRIYSESLKNSQEINQLDKRIQELEIHLGKKNLGAEGKESKAPAGPIKSLTFRLGSKDDRLRIYWADGSNSDLPCTKEQSIWVCG